MNVFIFIKFVSSNILYDSYSRNNRISWQIDKSWEDAAQIALNEAKKTIRGITGIEVLDMTARVDPNSGSIKEYHTSVKIAFGVEHQ